MTFLLPPLLFAAAFPVLAVAELLMSLQEYFTLSPFDPSDKVIVVTGASSGIGQQIAIKYAAKNANVVLVARRPDQLKVVAQKCREAGAKSVRLECVDVGVEEDVKRVMVQTGTVFGHIDLVVLNAGISMGEYAREVVDISAYTSIMQTNFNGFVAGVIYALPYLKKAKRGKIVGVSSLLGLVGGETRTGYCASKFAMKGFLDSLRLEEPSIDCTMVYPGVVNTDINRTRIGNKGHINTDGPNVMTAEEAADRIVDAVNRGARDDVYTFNHNLLYYIKDVFPRVRDAIMRANFKKLLKKNV
ncbi:UNVERIFIED_CONTAM: hypothetical protein HDU68_011517 [Siphonaria sp. JEL0065]|nr:hypothetical protein HDU68_011517 [Siphonaria sp. JEL0065]